MDFTIPHEIIYDTPHAVPVSDVIDSLLGTERAANELRYLLEGCVDGLSITSLKVGVRSISQESPLRELFFFTLVVTFQKDLEQEVPAMLEKLFNTTVPDQYDSVVTVCLLIVLFYGADYLYRKYHSATASSHIGRQLRGLVADLSRLTGCPEDKIRAILEEKYGGNRLRSLARSAMQVFRPSKHQSNAPVRTAGRVISQQTISEMPGDIAEDVIGADDTSEYLANVEIEIHAQDIDRARQGWAATNPGHVNKRLRMQIFPPVKPEEIWTSPKISGDVVIVSERQDDGELKPVMIHLLRVSK